MVGLYYKRREQRSQEQRSQNKFMRFLGKCGLSLLALIIVGFVLVVFFFNGERIKGPLSAYLSNLLGTKVSIGSADFSPLYPDVMRLSDIRFGNSNINELYIEYDILSAISEHELKLTDLYINGMKLSDNDLKLLASSKEGYTSISAEVMRLNHIPLQLRNLRSEDLNLRLFKARYDEDGLSFEQGRLSALEATLFGEKVSNLNLDFKQSDQGFLLSNLSVNLLGGTISGTGMFYPTNLEDLLSTDTSLTPCEQDQNSRDTAINPTNATATFATASAGSATSHPRAKSHSDNANADLDLSQIAAAQNPSAASLSQDARTFIPDTSKLTSSEIKLENCSDFNHISTFLPSAGHIDFDELYLTKIIMPENLQIPGNLALTAKNTILSDVIVTNQNRALIATTPKSQPKDAAGNQATKTNEDEVIQPISEQAQAVNTHNPPASREAYSSFVLQGINGNISNFSLNKSQLLGTFKGEIDELSLPNLQTVFENNQARLHFHETGLDFELQGKVYEGDYQVRGKYNRDQTLLSLDDLKLKQNKLELTKERWEFLQNGLTTYQVKLGSLSFNNLEFLSYINSFPVSIQSISGNAADWQFNNPQRKSSRPLLHPNVLNHTDLKIAAPNRMGLLATPSTLTAHQAPETKGKLRFNIEGDPAALLNLDLTNVLYSDLRMRKGQCIVTLSDDIINISIPNLQFGESALSAQATLGLVESKASSYFMVNTTDFEIADLNSNLINHLLTGKVDLKVDLSSHHDSLDQTWENLEGQIKLTSDAMLISDLGLDLINGGPKRNYSLSGTELMTAIQGSVAGINNLDMQVNFANHTANISGAMDLATGSTIFNGQVDLGSQEAIGQALLTSLAQDSSTQVLLSGSLNEPKFDIFALKRGEPRPGLYLPQYEASAIAKEPTDTILNSFEGYTALEQASESNQNSAPPANSESVEPNDAAKSNESGKTAFEQYNTPDELANTTTNEDASTANMTADANAQSTTSSEPTQAALAEAPSSEHKLPAETHAQTTSALNTTNNIKASEGAKDKVTLKELSQAMVSNPPLPQANVSEISLAKAVTNTLTAQEPEMAKTQDTIAESTNSARATEQNQDDTTAAQLPEVNFASLSNPELAEPQANSTEAPTTTATTTTEEQQPANAELSEPETAPTPEAQTLNKVVPDAVNNTLESDQATTNSAAIADSTAPEATPNQTADVTELAATTTAITTIPESPSTDPLTPSEPDTASAKDVDATLQQSAEPTPNQNETNLTADTTAPIATTKEAQSPSKPTDLSARAAIELTQEAVPQTEIKPASLPTPELAAPQSDSTATTQEPKDEAKAETDTVEKATLATDASQEQTVASQTTVETVQPSTYATTTTKTETAEIEHTPASDESKLPESEAAFAATTISDTDSSSLEQAFENNHEASEPQPIGEVSAKAPVLDDDFNPETQETNAPRSAEHTPEPNSTVTQVESKVSSQPTTTTTDTTITPSTQTVDLPEPDSTQVELKPSDSVDLAQPLDHPIEAPETEQHTNTETNQAIQDSVPAAESPATKSQQQIKQKADALEQNLLEQAAFDSFFSFQDLDAEDEEELANPPASSKEVFKFNNDDDELIF